MSVYQSLPCKWREKDEVISHLLLWEPKHGARKRGRPATTYVNQLRNDTGLSIAELKNIMGNRKEWMKLVNGVRANYKQANKQCKCDFCVLLKAEAAHERRIFFQSVV